MPLNVRVEVRKLHQPPFQLPTMITTKQLTISGCALTGVAALALITKYALVVRASRVHRARALAVKSLLEAGDDLAEEHVEVPDQVRDTWAMEDIAMQCAPAKGDDVDVDSRGVVASRSGTFEYDRSRRPITQFSVVSNKTGYTRALVAEAKNRFGKPQRNNANLLAVRKFCLDKMSKHGVRPSHIAKHLALCVELVFIESQSECEAREMMESYRIDSLSWYSWAVTMWEQFVPRGSPAYQA